MGLDTNAEQPAHRCNFDPKQPGPAARQRVVCACGWVSVGTGTPAVDESFDHLDEAARAAGTLRPHQVPWTLPADAGGSGDWVSGPFPEATR